MSLPLRSTITPPRWPSTMPAPALITMAMPAMTAKAKNRLPLTPNLRELETQEVRVCPMLNRNAIAPAPRRYLG